MQMRASHKEDGSGIRIWIALLLLATTAILFVALCLVLEDWQVRPADATTQSQNVFLSQPALIVYCTILAGVLGTAVRILGHRLSTEASQTGLESVGVVAAQVFLGGAFAFVAGFLVPHALATKTIGDSYNVWSLMIVGGLAGYASTGIAGSVHEGLQGLLAGLRQGVAEAIVKEEVSRTIAQSAKEALALPEPIAYAGIIEIDITDASNASVVQKAPYYIASSGSESSGTEGVRILLVAGEAYTVLIRLVPRGAAKGPRSTRPIALPIDVEGAPAATAPLEVRIDYGLDGVPSERQQVDAPTTLETELSALTFITPSIQLPTAPIIAQDDEPNIPRRLTIAVLQNRIPYVRRQIPLEFNTSGPLPQAMRAPVL